MRLFTILSLGFCAAIVIMFGGFFVALSIDANRKRDQGEQDAAVIKSPLSSREAKAKAFDRMIVLGISISDVSRIVGCTPWKTEVVPHGDVLPDFGIIARENLVVCRWRLPGDFVDLIGGRKYSAGEPNDVDVVVVFSHKRNAAIEKWIW